MVKALIPASATALVMSFLAAQLAERGHPVGFSTRVPDRNRPDRFATVQQLNTTTDHDFADNALIRISYYDCDEQRAEHVSTLIKGLMAAMPTEFAVQHTEHAGGPSHQNDPDIPRLTRYLLTTWVTVPTRID